MSTRLIFQGPADLSVGRIRIQGADGVIEDWTATNDRRRVEKEVKPGFYVAQIEPIGIRAQSVVFEVKEGLANNVVVPDFLSLASSGDAATVLETDGSGASVSARPSSARPTSDVALGAIAAKPIDLPRPARSAATKRRITIMLAEEENGRRERWRPFMGDSSLEVIGRQIQLKVKPEALATIEAGHRVRLSVALEKSSVERLLVPMYLGGTSITLTASSFSTADLEFEVTPSEPHTRSLFRALGAGTSAAAKAVKDELFESKAHDLFRRLDRDDPWIEILVGLLSVRFPTIFDDLLPGWAEFVSDRYPWMTDAHVLAAWSALQRRQQEPEISEAAATKALTSLARALKLGAPYYSYSGQLVGELLDILSAATILHPSLGPICGRLRGEWFDLLPLQSSTGPSFQWRRRSKRDKSAVIADSRSTGRLDPTFGRMVFRGSVQLGKFVLNLATNRPPKDKPGKPRDLDENDFLPCPDEFPERPPAFFRKAGPADDPNKGRFGVLDERNGFRLFARFLPNKSERWATIELIVEAKEQERAAFGDSVYFCLHPTFRERWVKARFVGRRASFILQAWGGFTVGAWLPDRHVELECDLSKLEGAPKIVREE